MVDIIIYPTWYSSNTVLAKGDPNWYNVPAPDFQVSFCAEQTDMVLV